MSENRENESIELQIPGKKYLLEQLTPGQTRLLGKLTGELIVTHLVNEDLRERNAEVVIRSEAIARAANTDSLTGLLNKDGLRSAYNRFASQPTFRIDDDPSQPKRIRNSVLIADLDKFKRVNRQLGHGGADTLLQKVGEVLASSLRTTDIAGRFGGDEFVVILPGITPDQAKIAAERIRTDIATLGKHELPGLTMSIGVGPIDPALSLERTIEEADLALYQAKAQGRDQVVGFGQPENP